MIFASRNSDIHALSGTAKFEPHTLPEKIQICSPLAIKVMLKPLIFLVTGK